LHYTSVLNGAKAAELEMEELDYKNTK